METSAPMEGLGSAIVSSIKNSENVDLIVT